MTPRLEGCDQCREGCSRTLNDYTYFAPSSTQISRSRDSMGKKSQIFEGIWIGVLPGLVTQIRLDVKNPREIISPLLNKRCGVIHQERIDDVSTAHIPMLDYACPVWKHAADNHLWSFQVFQFKFLLVIAGEPCGMLAIYRCMRIWSFYK